MKRLSALTVLIMFALCTGASAGTKVTNSTTKATKGAGATVGPIDTALTPACCSPTPTPYPSITKSVGKSKSKVKIIEGSKVKVKGSNIKRSAGDEAGVAGGLITSKNKDKVKFKFGTSKVKVEGKNVTRQSDVMFHNKKNIAK